MQSNFLSKLHVGIIMDGNGRWATRQRLSRLRGHEAGVEAIRRVVEAAPQQGVGTLTADEARVLALVLPEETHIEAIIQASQLPAQVVASILVKLELQGVIRQFPGKFFVRC